jgi:hypothetical protein
MCNTHNVDKTPFLLTRKTRKNAVNILKILGQEKYIFGLLFCVIIIYFYIVCKLVSFSLDLRHEKRAIYD